MGSSVGPDRMFRVIVMGGFALAAACGGSTQPTGDAGNPADGPAGDAADAAEEFPSELPAMIDSGPQPDAGHGTDAAGDGATDADAGFPQEAPAP